MIEQVSPTQLAQWLKTVSAFGRPVLLDVREPNEWAMASVSTPQAQLLQISMGDIPARWQELDPERPIAALCHHGCRSMQVATYLQKQGFEHLANIVGGIDAWSTELDPSVPKY